jgi:hypothetical protein
VYNEIVCITHFFLGPAHHIYDYLPAILMFPKTIRDTAFFVLRKNYTFVVSALSYLGIHHSRIVISQNDPIYARTLYTVDPITCVTVRIRPCREFTAYFTRLFLTDQAPIRYAIQRRFSGGRSYSNFDHVFFAVTEAFLDYHWEVCIDNVPEFQAVFRYYQSVLLLAAVHGAGLANVLFMQPGTVVCEVVGPTYTPHYLWLSACLGVRHFYILDRSLVHFGEEQVYGDPTIMIAVIRRGFRSLG